jgi:putative cell wall-binding protein
MHTFLKRGNIAFLVALGGALLLSACSAKQAAMENISRADLAIRHVEQTDTSKYAPLEIHEAQEKLVEAKKAKEEGDYKVSRQLSDEALVNTQLAEAKVLSGKTREIVKESKRNTETLQKETNRNRDARRNN